MRIARREVFILGVVSAISLTAYLFVSVRLTGWGFPLDDAWIHQTYARNLALSGEWSFVPGQPSAGLTAPVWGLALVPGHLLGWGPYALTFLYGWLSLWAAAVLAAQVIQRLAPERAKWALAGGVALALEWHVVWAAGSGMETLPFSVLAVYILVRLLDAADGPLREWAVLGALVGLLVWLRPEGLTLLGPIGLVILLAGPDWHTRIHRGAAALAGTLALFIPYLLFNRWLAGAYWPNTLFAKQAEYAILRQAPLLSRLLEQYALPLSGVGIILLPGFVALLVMAVRNRWWAVLAGGLWPVGHLTLYALRLPVVYQHGRYAIPAMLVYFVWGLAGVALVLRPNDRRLWPRVGSQTWAALVPLVALSFWLLGANAYAQDVAVINTEMVATANWLAENTQPDDLVAAHDIGAIGYFAQRPLLDLAGLISPDVIPFIRDEAELANYLDQQNPAYLVTFPGWYPELVKGLPLAFKTNGPFAPELGGENMTIYVWE